MGINQKDKNYITPQSHDDMLDAMKYGTSGAGGAKSPGIWTGQRVDVDIEAVKKSFDDLMSQRIFMGDLAESPIVTEEDLKEAREKLQKNLDHTQKRLDAIQKDIDFLASLPFRVGDAAFHRTLGNVLINGIVLNRGDLESSSYSITMTSGKRGQVALKDLVPISEATKVLYGKLK